jgi:hypothetical protein
MAGTIINITDDTPIAMLTVGQLREVLFPKALLDLIEKQQLIDEERIPRRYVHGVIGIKQLFNCSYPTAHKLKETILKPAIKQQGRVIVVDVDHAMKLFAEHEQIKSIKELKVK